MKQARRLGNYVEELSIKNNITPIQLSELLNCPEHFIQKLFKGRAFLTFPQLKLLADTLGVSVGDLLDDSNYVYDENREMILDLIDDYMDLYEAVEVNKMQNRERRCIRMRERLSQLIYNKLSETCRECSSFECTEELTDYLLANGVIVPPCKVGDKCYWINRVSNEIETDIVISIHQYENGLSITTITVGRKSLTTYSLNRFLEIMYVTKEEADAALVNYESSTIEKGGAEE